MDFLDDHILYSRQCGAGRRLDFLRQVTSVIIIDNFERRRAAYDLTAIDDLDAIAIRSQCHADREEMSEPFDEGAGYVTG